MILIGLRNFEHRLWCLENIAKPPKVNIPVCIFSPVERLQKNNRVHPGELEETPNNIIEPSFRYISQSQKF